MVCYDTKVIKLLFSMFIWFINIQSISLNQLIGYKSLTDPPSVQLDNEANNLNRIQDEKNFLDKPTGFLTVAERLQVNPNNTDQNVGKSWRPMVTNIVAIPDKLNDEGSNCTIPEKYKTEFADYLNYVEIIFELVVILYTSQVYLLTKCSTLDAVRGVKSFHDTQTTTRTTTTTRSRKFNPFSTQGKGVSPVATTRSKFFDAISHYFG